MTVAGVPVVVAAYGVVTVTVSRFALAAASRLLRVHPRFSTTAVGVYIVDETGDTAHRPDQRWFFDLYPGRAGARDTIRPCDGIQPARQSRLRPG